MKIFRYDPLSLLLLALGLFVFSMTVTLCSLDASRAGELRTTPTQRPLTVLPPTGGPIYVHPSQSPTGPAVILSPNALPTYVHPPTSSYGPATIISPDSGPTYVWPSGQ